MSAQNLVLYFPFLFLWKKGGGGSGDYSVFKDMSFLRCTNFRLYFFICSITPCLNQVFRLCFSMENLRAYAEDEAPASSVQPPVTKGPNTSEGLSTSSSSSASVPSMRTLSGPVQEVSTRSSLPLWSPETRLCP